MILEVQNGCFGYPKQPVILENINLRLEEGHILAILGPNGIGKTTLLKCMIGLLPWHSGKTLLYGKDIEKFKAKYGDHVHVLDWALHLDESTPHIHERHVFDCENKYGEVAPQQEKALESLGFELPDPDKPLSRRNNR